MSACLELEEKSKAGSSASGEMTNFTEWRVADLAA
jgi:hypothetical protein